MCKHCKLEDISRYEKGAECREVGCINDGSISYNLYLNRYITDEDRINELILSIMAEEMHGGGKCVLREEHVDIKYCPFCGEEL